VIPRDGPELAHDLRLDADFLDELAREALLQQFARIETTRRHLSPRFRQITMLEDEQLVAAGHVRNDAEGSQLCFARSMRAVGYAARRRWRRRPETLS
jgi:hypothetical protein